MAKATSNRRPLDRDHIVDTAVALADAGGIETLSMRKLAGELGVEAMSLYYHVPSKDALLDGMVDRVIGEIALPSLDGAWKPEMRARAVSAHETLQRHPWAIGLVDSRRNRSPESLRYYDAMIGCLLNAGFTVELAAHALSAIDAYVYGFGIQEENLPLGDEEEVAEVSEELLAQMTEQEFTHLTRMIVEVALQPGYDFSAEFAWGLDLVLDALEREREQIPGK